MSERLGTQKNTDNDHDGGVDKSAVDDFFIVEIEFILVQDCPPEEFIDGVIFEFFDGLGGHLFVLLGVVKIFFGRFVVAVVDKVLVVGFAVGEEVEGFLLKTEVHEWSGMIID